MKIKTLLTTLLMALSFIVIMTSCTSEEFEPITDAESAVDQSWTENESPEADSTLIGNVNVKFTSDFSVSDLFTHDRKNNMYTVPLIIYRKGSIYNVTFKPKGFEINYEIENPAWFPTVLESYNITILANYNDEISYKNLRLKVDGIAPNQELHVSVEVKYIEDGITTKCRLAFVAVLKGSDVVIIDKNQIIS